MHDVQYVVRCCMGAVSIEMGNAKRVQNGEAKIHVVMSPDRFLVVGRANCPTKFAQIVERPTKTV